MKYSDEMVRVHFINDNDDKIVMRQTVYHVPSVGDNIRIGKEKYYIVNLVVWVYDEPECPFGRANIGVVPVPV